MAVVRRRAGRPDDHHAPAAAQDRLDAAAAALTRATAQPRDEAVAVGRMGSLLGVTPEALRAQRTSVGLGWGDFFVARRIAARGGHPVDKVFAARRTGTGWSAIAEEANVSSDLLVQDVAAVWPEAARATAVPARPVSRRRRAARRRPARRRPLRRTSRRGWAPGCASSSVERRRPAVTTGRRTAPRRTSAIR